MVKEIGSSSARFIHDPNIEFHIEGVVEPILHFPFSAVDEYNSKDRKSFFIFS